jgi:hypothetical protein
MLARRHVTVLLIVIMIIIVITLVQSGDKVAVLARKKPNLGTPSEWLSCARITVISPVYNRVLPSLLGDM